jgi:hypothetical protein
VSQRSLFRIRSGCYKHITHSHPNGGENASTRRGLHAPLRDDPRKIRGGEGIRWNGLLLRSTPFCRWEVNSCFSLKNG